MDEKREDTIWYRVRMLDKQLSEEQQRLIEDYKKNVYWPARKALIEECAAKGHVRGKFHDNGWGWTWYYCINCGTPFDKECYLQPSTEDDDGEEEEERYG